MNLFTFIPPPERDYLSDVGTAYLALGCDNKLVSINELLLFSQSSFGGKE